MARTAGDSWSITESVGATALMVAVARALESRKAQPLAADPFAETLVRASGAEFWNKVLDGAPELTEDPDTAPFGDLVVDRMAVRTKFFDDLFTTATASGVRQFVILAAGLDARAYRLDFPAGTRVFELDQPQVLAFKAQTLDGHTPTAQRVAVPVDLREDWPSALAQAGFDDKLPTVWLVEGLIAYLPATAQDLLFERIIALSAPGSEVGVNARAGGKYSTERPLWRKSQEQWAKHGLDLKMEDLIYEEDRADSGEWLAERGWQATAQTFEELLAQAGRERSAGPEEGTPRMHFIHAVRK